MSGPASTRAKGEKAPPGLRRLAARLAAVQAAYQLAMSDSSVEEVTEQFLRERLNEEVDGLSLAEADRKLFRRLVEGPAKEGEDYDNMLAGALPEGWPLERIETLMRVLFRAAIYELADEPETPARVVITQYVEVAHAFFGRKEPGFVNAVLDRVAHDLRPEEFEVEGDKGG